MSLDLKSQLTHSPFTSTQQKEVLELDTNRDGRLDPQDLNPVFGRSASLRFFAEIESSIQKNDFTKFRGAMGKLEQARAQFFLKSFQETMLQKRDVLMGLGVVFQGAKLRFDSVPSQNIGKAAEILSEVLRSTYGQEFKALNPKESGEFSFRVGEFIRHPPTGRDSAYGIDTIAQHLFVKESSYWDAQADARTDQKEYADQAFHEIHTPAHVAALETKYHIDLRRSGGEITPAQAQILDRVLGTLQKKLPADFARIPSITLHLGEERTGGLSHMDHGGAIDLYGPFSPPISQ